MTIAHTVSLVRSAFADEAFTSAEAQAHGIGPDRLERASRAGTLRRLRKGIYVLGSSEVADALALVTCRARLLSDRGILAVIAGSTSAGVWDVPIIGARPDAMALNPTLYVDATSGVREGMRDGVRVVRTDLAPQDVWEGGTHSPSVLLSSRLLVCMPMRTAVDITRHLRLGVAPAVAALSAAQRRHAALVDGGTPPPTLRAIHAEGPHGGGWRAESQLTGKLQSAHLREMLNDELMAALLRTPRLGLRHVYEGLPYVDPRLETALEAISWTLMRRSGLPVPLLQHWVTGASGKRYRVDFFWPEFRLIGEADGAIKYRRVADVMAEKDRHADLADAGHGFVRWTWHDAWVTQAFLGRIERSMGRAVRR